MTVWLRLVRPVKAADIASLAVVMIALAGCAGTPPAAPDAYDAVDAGRSVLAAAGPGWNIGAITAAVGSPCADCELHRDSFGTSVPDALGVPKVWWVLLYRGNESVPWRAEAGNATPLPQEALTLRHEADIGSSTTAARQLLDRYPDAFDVTGTIAWTSWTIDSTWVIESCPLLDEQETASCTMYWSGPGGVGMGLPDAS